MSTPTSRLIAVTINSAVLLAATCCSSAVIFAKDSSELYPGPANADKGSLFVEILPGFPDIFRGAAVPGDYDQDGDLDVLLAGSDIESNYLTRIYQNNGTGAFIDTGVALPGVWFSALAWGDYDQDNDLDILISGLTESGQRIARVYENSGGGEFTDVGAGLTGVRDGFVAWGDYDNDGDLDILLTGSDAIASSITKLYRNEGGGNFTDMAVSFPAVLYSSGEWGDYDNDGDLDVLLAGLADTGVISAVYRNDGNGTFVDINSGLEGLRDCSVAWGDYDADGDLDILLSGLDASLEPISSVYRNDGEGTFVEIGNAFLPVGASSAKWGDYDNDGDLDILLSGWTRSTGPIGFAEVYRNEGGDVFVGIGAGLPEVWDSSTAWVDLDGDSDLDILLVGFDRGPISRWYENQTVDANTKPNAPANLSAVWLEDRVIFSWDAGLDNETPTLGLNYNLRVGTTPGGNEITSPMAAVSDGRRHIAQFGNVGASQIWALEASESLYYWSVQAIDGAFAGSDFPAEQMTSEPPATVPEIGDVPEPFVFSMAQPNPFRTQTSLMFELSSPEQITLVIYNAAGREVRQLGPRLYPVGRHALSWDGEDETGRSVSPGIYFAEINAGSYQLSQRLTRLQ